MPTSSITPARFSGALRSSFSYYRTLPIDRRDNAVWRQTLLPMPVLAIGTEWGYGPASERTIRRVATDVRAAIIERCGHYPAEERPAELARAILEFLAMTPLQRKDRQ